MRTSASNSRGEDPTLRPIANATAADATMTAVMARCRPTPKAASLPSTLAGSDSSVTMTLTVMRSNHGPGSSGAMRLARSRDEALRFDSELGKSAAGRRARGVLLSHQQPCRRWIDSSDHGTPYMGEAD